MNYSGAVSNKDAPLRRTSRHQNKHGGNSAGNTQDYADLVETDETTRNYRGIAIALLVIISILALITVAIVLVRPDNAHEDQREAFTFADLFDDNFTAHDLIGQWLPGGNMFVYVSRDGDLVVHDAAVNVSVTILDGAAFHHKDKKYWQVSHDLQYILVASDVQSIHTHSFTAKYVIYTNRSATSNDATRQFIRFPRGDEWAARRLQSAACAPRQQGLVFVYSNNLYFQAGVLSPPVQLTQSGKHKQIYNGIPDWLYEEEILSSSVAYWWSPDGRFIAYISFNDTLVPVYRYPLYTASTAYGGMAELPYPKAGDDRPHIIPTVTLRIVDLQNVRGAHRTITPPSELTEHDHYITMVVWRDDSHILVSWSNRVQDRAIVTLCDVMSTDCIENLDEKTYAGRGWVTINSVKFIYSGANYLAILPAPEANGKHWKHIALVTSTMDAKGTKLYITRGSWEVADIIYFDHVNSTIYFTTGMDDPRQRHLYRTKILQNGGRYYRPECLTCSRSERCNYVEAQFSDTGDFYLEKCLGPGVPTYTLHSTTNNETLTVLEENNELQERMSTKALPVKEYFTFENEAGDTLYGELYVPPTLKKEHITQYPLLLEVRSSIGTQLVTERFRLDWRTYLSSSEHVVYATVDGRGSGGRGDDFLYAVHRRLGTVDVQDQLAAIRYINDSYQFVDATRIAVWGCFYGGFITALTLSDDDNDDLCRCGIAVSPIVDWLYYDSAFAERIMGLASNKDNYKGYDHANVSAKAENFAGKSFLIVHGTADEIVHLQHSAKLMKALTESAVDYRAQLYTDAGHDLLEHTSVRRHLLQTILAFLRHNCWQGGLPSETRSAVDGSQKKGKN